MIFIVIAGFIIYIWVSRFIKNERSPIVATRARLIKKKTDTHINNDSNGMISTSETLYLIYELDTGSTIKFSVGSRVYRNAPENEWGTLTFKGSRFLKFENNNYVIER